MNSKRKKWIEDRLNKKLEDGIYIKKTWDIRIVENFFKKLFGIKKKNKEKKNDQRRKKERR